jgi:hypothetical protein
MGDLVRGSNVVAPRRRVSRSVARYTVYKVHLALGVLVPLLVLDVLDPLVVAHGDAPGVRRGAVDERIWYLDYHDYGVTDTIHGE